MTADQLTRCAVCPTREGEKLEPPGLGYVGWHEWAGVQVAAGWTTRTCPDCGLYTVWQPPKDDR